MVTPIDKPRKRLNLAFDSPEPRYLRTALADADQADAGRVVNKSAWKPDLEAYDSHQAQYWRAA